MKDLFSFSVEQIVPPNITLNALWVGKYGESAVKLMCTLSGFIPKEISVEWQRDNKKTDAAIIQKKFQTTDEEPPTFSLSSEILPNMEEWKKGSSFQCKSTHKKTESSRSISICDSKY